MYSSFSPKARPAVVLINPTELQSILCRTIPFYMLSSAGLHADPYYTSATLVIDGETATCVLAALVGDSEEPVMVILKKIHDGLSNTFVVLERHDAHSDGENIEYGSLIPRAVVYEVEGFEDAEVAHVLGLIRALM